VQLPELACYRGDGSDNGPRLAAFVHVPLMPRDASHRLTAAVPAIDFEQLVDAGEALLVEMLRQVRRHTAEM
jgi:pyroglutamyl-peptidase